jgi:hypothetical protein
MLTKGLEPKGAEWKQLARKLRLDVKQHNAKFKNFAGLKK